MNTEFRRQYFERMLEVSATGAAPLESFKRPHLPKSLYRFRSGNPHSLEALTSHTTWLAAPNDFNDPFDSSFAISPREFGAQYLRSQFRVICRKLNLEFSEDEKENVEQAGDPLGEILRVYQRRGTPVTEKVAQFLSTISSDWAVTAFDKVIARGRDSIRLCCFSERVDSILMWSHYSEFHRGFCLEYDTGSLLSDDVERAAITAASLHPVHYADKLLDATARISPDNPFIPLMVACTKSLEWAYEEEWRFIWLGSGKCVYSFGKPKCVILSAKITDELRAKVRAIVLPQGIKLAQAELAKDSFRLVFRDLS